MRVLWFLSLVIALVSSPLAADRAAYVDLARRGWSYELRTTMVGRDLSIPVHIHGKDLAGASLCLVGERPHEASITIINAFRSLALHAFGKRMPMRYAGRSAANCGSGRTVVLRLYSGHPPNRDLSADLRWMNKVYQLGLPARGDFAASSPAMAQTFFGRRGQGTHIMVKQPALNELGSLETAFYKSILIEELFQSFTFGMDILLFDRTAAFQSKLQETPLNLHRLPWSSRAFMRALVSSNPTGLCTFDVFMLHAVAEAPVDQTTEPGFIDYVDQNYDQLFARALATMADPQLAALFDPTCRL
ncbi:hypothetical protein [uncultured Roseobacter sp.]|uniref:hypothetical protein n=1 Tax=uncultured Roseobacter sp. TaxID=114847 RepID=UPI00261EEAD2|nr:hypothetical protein [uncultured Roseobacter sp.]